MATKNRPGSWDTRPSLILNRKIWAVSSRSSDRVLSLGRWRRVIKISSPCAAYASACVGPPIGRDAALI